MTAKRVALVFIIVFLAFAPAATPVAAQGFVSERPLIFGFLPIVSFERLARRFDPLLDYVAARIGVSIRMETAPNYAEFVRRTEVERRYDLLFTAPHFYYTAQRRAGYRVVVRVDQPNMYAVIVARRDSGIRSLSDLKGKSVATPDPLALGALLVKDRLISAGLVAKISVTLVATPSHNASLLSAVRSITSAAGLMSVPLSRADPAIRAQMRVLAKTENVPHMPFSVGPGLSVELSRKFTEIMVGMSSSGEGRKLLRHLHWPGFTPAAPNEYDSLRRFVGRSSKQ